MKEKYKIAFVLPSFSLPIPAVKGGAVETLMTILLEENEKMGKYEFLFISGNEKDEIKQWKHSKVFLLSNEGNDSEFPYDCKANNIVRNENVNFLIMEGLASRMDNCFRGCVPKKKMAIHLHSEIPRQGIYCNDFGITISPSKFLADKWNKESPENKSKTYLWQNAIDIDCFCAKISKQERIEIRKKIGLSETDFVVIFCGRLVEVKGVKELIRAVLSMNRPNLKLVIAGSDSFANGNKETYSKEVIKIANQYSKKIKYIGYVPNKMMPKIYQSADVQVIPSLWEEAFGLVVLEGMCSGLPLVYSNSGGIPELIPQNAGLMIRKEECVEEQIADKLSWLMENPEGRKEMAQKAYVHAKMYSPKRYYDEFDRMINWWKQICIN